MERHYGVLPTDCDQIRDLISGSSLESIWICNGGEQRSRDGASLLNIYGYMSIHISGGFEDIRELSEEQREFFFNSLVGVRNIFIILDREERAKYGSEIENIKSRNKNVLVCELKETILMSYAY